MNDTTIPVTYSKWSDGVAREHRSIRDIEDLESVTVVQEDLVIELHTTAPPDDAVVVAHTMLDDEAVPLEAGSIEIACLPPSEQSCVVDRGASSLSFLVQLPQNTRAVTLHLVYVTGTGTGTGTGTPGDENEAGVELLEASWNGAVVAGR